MSRTDCQAVYKRCATQILKKVPVWISLSGLSRQENSSSLSGSTATWKRSLSASKFGAPSRNWRRLINVEVDNWSATELKESAMSLKKEIKARDAVSRQVNGLLAKRVQALLEYDADQGPTVQWVEKSNKNPKNTQEGSKTRKKGQRLAIPVIKNTSF